MNLDQLKIESVHAENAERQSEEQLRQMTALLDRAGTPQAPVSPSDCAKLVNAALALNERLRDRAQSLRAAIKNAESPSMQRVREIARRSEAGL